MRTDQVVSLNNPVTDFLTELNHPLHSEIELLRRIILDSNPALAENIKWNAPNYSIGADDRITMRIHPPKKIQLIFHRGAKKLEQPDKRLIEDSSGLLVWKENDRAVASFNDAVEIETKAAALKALVIQWLQAAA